MGLERARARSWGLAAALRETLSGLDRIRVLDRGRELCAIVTVAVDGRDVDELVAVLREEGINTSAIHRPSAVLDLDQKGVTAALRLSPHYYNTHDEVRSTVAALHSLI